MYTEEPKRRINWLEVIKKGLLIVLIIGIILLIIWLFSRRNINKVNVNYDNNKNTNVQEVNKKNDDILDNDVYSEVFITNYTYYHGTAKDYFVTNELPTTGKSIKYTLNELINKGVLLKVKYGNTTCDLNSSYVEVKNNNGSYTMDTMLSCGKEIVKTTERIACSLLCDNKCKDEILEYQYKQAYKATETTYSCKSGYTKTGSGKNTKCIKNDSSSVSPNKETKYSCPEGFTKTGSGDKTKCTKTTTSKVDATKVNNYSCKTGYSLQNGKCVKLSTISTNPTYTTTYTCPSGYDKVGTGANTTCKKTTTVNADANTTYNCPTGYTLSNTKCVKTNYTPATPQYSCTTGTLVNTRYCRVMHTSTHYEHYTSYHGATYAGCSYSGSHTEACSTGSNCTQTVYDYFCQVTTYTDHNANVTYVCHTGTVSGNQCAIVDRIDATPTTTYSCNSHPGYTLNGNKCTKTETVKPTVKTTANCPSGYSLNNNKCYKNTTETISPIITVSYKCNDGYKLDGTKCVKTTTTSVNPNKDTKYSCPTGYLQHGNDENTICTKGKVTEIDPIKTTKTVTKYKYMWSKLQSISGWVRTGKTRKVNA